MLYEDRLLFISFMVLHYCTIGVVISNQPSVLGSPVHQDFLLDRFMRVDNYMQIN